MVVNAGKDEWSGFLRPGDDRDITVLSYELEKEDVMKFKPVYESLFLFFQEEGYTHPLSDDDKIEDLYWERWTPSGAKEQHVWWRVKKDINPYIRYFIAVNFQTLNVTKAEVPYKNKKINAEKIDFIIRVNCVLQWDVKNTFTESLGGKFKKAFFNHVYARELDIRKDELKDFGFKIQRFLKSYFEMAADKEHPATYYPPMGYKET